jgi:hypothetical protein
MNREITPLQADDLPALGEFLRRGFHVPADARFASPEVLRWKYLEPLGEGGPGDTAPRSYVAKDEAGAIVGHVGFCPTAFQGAGLNDAVSTLHMIDWLGSPGHPMVGARLMRKAHESAQTQFGLGGSAAARVVSKRGGYVALPTVPVYHRVLRPGCWLRTPGLGPLAKASRAARDFVKEARRRMSAAASNPITLERVFTFGDEIRPIVAQAMRHAVFTSREPGRLNRMLAYPGRRFTGWSLRDASGRARGFALLNVIDRHEGRVRLGMIVDCVLDDTDLRLWQGAMAALDDELKRQNADLAQTFAAPPWTAEGLQRAGYTTRFSLEFSLRDHHNLIPRTGPFHFTPIEADYAYT